MIKFYNKYKKPTASLILLGYLFLFGYNILHYHSYDANFSTNLILENKDDNRIANKHLVNPGFQCPVHNTYSSVHNILISGYGFYSNAITEVELLKFSPQQFYFQNQFYPSNSLRAPPEIS